MKPAWALHPMPATASSYPNHPASQGYVQMMGVFLDTLVICTCTASIVLVSGQLEPDSGVTGIELTQQALSSQVGDWGSLFIAIAIFFFAFTSIVGNYLMPKPTWFLEKKNVSGLFLLRFGTLAMVMFGAIGQQPLIWSLADVIMGFMATTNLIALLALSPIVIRIAQDYNQQLKQGKLPIFKSQAHPEVHTRLTPGIWDN